MTSLAQLLTDAGKKVTGSDVADNFVTEEILSKTDIPISLLEQPLPLQTEVVVYTAAHQGKSNPQVQQAIKAHIPVYSQAEALSFFFNQKKGIAVCGVGGKSTVSAMIAWILERTNRQPSYSVGVGKIVGLEKTGAWHEQSEFFVAEADEYATDPAAITQGEPLIPRFSYLQPFVTVCTHFKYDHPDVYADEAHTLSVFQTFLEKTTTDGAIILNYADKDRWSALSAPVMTFGKEPQATLSYSFDHSHSKQGLTVGTFTYQTTSLPITLQVPGEYNLENAAAATLTVLQLGISLQDAIEALATFQSTARRFEKKGEWNGAVLYDDYAHHPSELAAVITALNQWYPNSRCIIAFQPHTYSRTKSLFSEFAQVLTAAKELVLLDIFASARESFDPTVTSAQLAEAIKKQSSVTPITILANYHELAAYLHTSLKPGDVCLTVGAGDVYKSTDELLKKV